MRALTVRQPWAWAIFHGKDVENRSGWRYSYVGPLLIHAGKHLADKSAFERVREWSEDLMGQLGAPKAPTELAMGSLIGVVDLAGAHWWQDCYRLGSAGARMCSRWAERDAWHLELTKPLVLQEPIGCPGRLGLWKPPLGTEAAVRLVRF